MSPCALIPVRTICGSFDRYLLQGAPQGRGLASPRRQRAHPAGPRYGNRHALRTDLLETTQDQCEYRLCRSRRRRAAGEQPDLAGEPYDYDLSSLATRRVGSSRSRIPSARKCYPCLRNEVLPMSPKWTQMARRGAWEFQAAHLNNMASHEVVVLTQSGLSKSRYDSARNLGLHPGS